IAASNEQELADCLETVFHRFAKAGLRLKSDKCKFCLPCVEFLDFEIDTTGINLAKTKVQAIQDAPTPKNKQQLQAFLGLLNFYHSFVEDKATVAEPLHRLLDKNARWIWTSKHEKAFRDVKRLLSSDAVLTHYDGKKPLVLVCDASQHGIGAVLCHKLSSTQEIPIAFYSRTLSTIERNYAQIDKEALAVIAGVKKFHEYLLRTVLDRLQPDVVPEDLDKKFEKVRTFQTDDQVYAKNYSSEKTWKPAIVVTPTGPLSYQVQSEDGQLWRRHIDQLRKRYVTAIPDEHRAVVTTPREETAAVSPSPDSESVGQQRSSTRKRRPPQWLRDYER
ncbi:hypothetical protein D917_01379, partial [Trichinella nativa]